MTVTFAQLGKYGRLGNQLWQIAATIGYSHRHGCDYALPQWEYASQFNIPAESFRPFKSKNSYNEPYFHYAGIPFKPDTNLHGYFQSYKYWHDCEGKIRRLLTPKRYQEKLLDTTAIHVRRTDYLTHKGCYEILGMNYYERAMAQMNTSKYLIFSDDISWCKKHFIGNQFEFSEGNSDVVDLSIMIKCINNIIANSSFSWWGAWLNPNPDKVVIAPKNWFGPKLASTHDTKDLLPSEWLKID